MGVGFLVVVVLAVCERVHGWQQQTGVNIRSTEKGLYATSDKKRSQRNRPKGVGRSAQNRRRGELVQGIIDSPQESRPRFDDDALMPLIKCAAQAADMRKASDTVAYHVSPVTDMTCFLLLTNGRSKPQNEAIAAAIVDEVEKEIGRLPERIEGGADGGWTVIDYGDVIAHVMTPLSRDYYQIDTLWQAKNGVQAVDLSDVIMPSPYETEENDDNTLFDPNQGLILEDWDELLSESDASLISALRSSLSEKEEEEDDPETDLPLDLPSSE